MQWKDIHVKRRALKESNKRGNSTIQCDVDLKAKYA